MLPKALGRDGTGHGAFPLLPQRYAYDDTKGRTNQWATSSGQLLISTLM